MHHGCFCSLKIIALSLINIYLGFGNKVTHHNFTLTFAYGFVAPPRISAVSPSSSRLAIRKTKSKFAVSHFFFPKIYLTFDPPFDHTPSFRSNFLNKFLNENVSDQLHM